MKSLSVIVLLLILSPANIRSQEIGVSPVKYWSDTYELENPLGIGLYLSQSLGILNLKFEYSHARNTRTYYGGILYGFYDPTNLPAEENVTSDSYLNAYDLSIEIPSIIDVYQIQINLGLGAGINNFSGYRTGDTSNKTVQLFNESKFGYFYTLSLSRYYFLRTPIKLEFLLKHKRLQNSVYLTDTEQPFSSIEDLKQIQLYIAYVF